MSMFPWLVADIGGTNARFGLVTELSKKGTFVVERVQKFKGVDFANFDVVMAAYLAEQSDVTVRSACIAIAGPVVGDYVEMTNLPWHFSQQALKEKFDLEQFVAINDYTALALSAVCLTDADLVSIIPGEREASGNKAILGPGTGLGVAGLTYAQQRWHAISSQGGHVNLPASDASEYELLGELMRKYQYVSAETCLSGSGLVNIYQALVSLSGQVDKGYSPSDLSELAVSGGDPLATKTLSLFCALFGSAASNAALTYGATGGVYITGGIIPRFVEFFKQSAFKARFQDKGPMSTYVKPMPVDLVIHDTPALIGSAQYLSQI